MRRSQSGAAREGLKMAQRQPSSRAAAPPPSIDSRLACAYPIRMTSPAITFDRLAYIDRLKEAGFDDKQARARADALDTALRDSVATKADLRESELRLEAKIETTAANLRADIARWLVAAVIAIGGLNLAAVKFMK
jgi:hypothetical protein